MKKFALLALGALLSVATSCQKEDIRVQQPTAQAQTSNSAALDVADCRPDNRDNKFDSTGVYHNLALDYVDAHRRERTLEEAVALSNKYADMTFRERDPELVLPTAEQMRELLRDTTSWFTKTIESTRYSDKGKARLRQLMGIIRETGYATSGDYCAIKTNVMSFEKQIANSDELSPEEQAVVLRAASVARYSLYRWLVQAPGERQGRGTPATASRRPFWQLLIIGACDVAGGIAGSAGGPVGTVTGASGASSAANTIFDIFDPQGLQTTPVAQPAFQTGKH